MVLGRFCAAIELALGSPRIMAGTVVEAKYMAGAAWYPGKVQMVNADGTFVVAFDDGDFQHDVRAGNIRAAARAPSSADCVNLYGAVGLLMRLTEHPRAYRPRAERIALALVTTLRNRKIQGIMRTLARSASPRWPRTRARPQTWPKRSASRVSRRQSRS